MGRGDWFRRCARGILLLAVTATGITVSAASWAGVPDLEKDLQGLLEKSRQIVSQAAQKAGSGRDISGEIQELGSVAENVRITHLLLEERYTLRDEKVAALGAEAVDRHRAMVKGYQEAIREYLEIIETQLSAFSDQRKDSSKFPVQSSQKNNSVQLSADSDQLAALNKLKNLLDKLLPKKKRPLIGSLPYQHLNYPPVEPSGAPEITPAYKGGNKTVSTEDTAGTPEAPISREIAALAQSLGWSPVSIYEYVKNNVQTEWYWGCMKGAEETLRQKSGNDCDQATLLAALLRASGFPTRYVRGTIEFFPDIERAKALTGIKDPAKIAELFQKAGIPHTAVISGGKVTNIQFEHLWVESQIPYANYRGALIDENGKTWLGLDTSIKVKGYQENQPKDIFELSAVSDQVSAIRDEYLKLVQPDPSYALPDPVTVTPLEYLKSKLSAVSGQLSPELTADSYTLTRSLIPEVMNILPAGLQFVEKNVTNEYTTMPEELKHKIKLSAVSGQQSANVGRLFEIKLDAMQMSNQQVTITYEPETVADQETINAWGGLDNTPAYLVRLRPVLEISGQRSAVSSDGLPMGAEYQLSIELISPNRTEQITNTLISGNLTAIGIVSQRAVSSQQSAVSAQPQADSSQLNAETLLHNEAINYIDRWNQAEDELASLLHLTIARPIPTVVTLGGVIEVTYMLDTPHGFTWKGVYIDADVRRIEAVSGQQSADSLELNAERLKLFMQLSSLQGSVLEHRVFEDDWKVASISTAKMVQISSQQSADSSQPSAVSGELYTIDRTNIETFLPPLNLDEGIKDDIRNSVNQDLVVRLPQADGSPLTAISYKDWSGIGYITEKPTTGESGWMLSGVIAGGMTSSKKQEWINKDLVDILTSLVTGTPNTNPAEVVKLVRVKAGDYQQTPVDSVLAKPLQVQAQDRSGRPVQGVEVTYTITAGGGNLQYTAATIANQDNKTLTVTTGQDGIADIWLQTGPSTTVSPFYMAGNPNIIQVGLNAVTVSTEAWGSDITTDKPFEAFGLPGPVDRILKVYGDSTETKKVTGNPNTFSGTLLVRVVDFHGNPLSNEMVTFKVKPQTFLSDVPTGEVQNARIYRNSGDCPGIPTLSCLKTSETISNIVTDTSGALTYVILGNTDNTKYQISAEANKTANGGFTIPIGETFTHYTSRIDRMYGFTEPFLSIGFKSSADEKGTIINAGIPGQAYASPLSTELLYTEEDMTVTDNSDGTCSMSGKGTFRTIPVSNTEPVDPAVYGGNVTFLVTGPNEKIGTINPEVQTNDTKGQYSAKLILDPSPARHMITATGMVHALVPKSCSGGQLVREESAWWNSHNGTTSVNTTVWGVKAVLDPLGLILVNEGGYPAADTVIPYHIEPTDYQPQTKQLFLYEKDTNGAERWIGLMDPNKDGKFVLSRGGAMFDMTKRYFVSLVLNLGSNMEIMSEKVALPVISILVKDDSYNLVKEIKFGRGDSKWPEKIYHIVTPGYINGDNCDGHSGRMSIVNKEGQLITAPTITGETYAVEYPLKFYKPYLPLGNNKCNVGVTDTLDGSSIKDKFIVSNRDRTVLDVGGLDLKAVLYGGLGNRIRIEIDGLLQEIPIEPVGVVILGIDGLRQDVLYAPSNANDGTNVRASYDDPNGCGENNRCYVEPTELKGLCDVLGAKYTETQEPSPLSPDETYPGGYGICDSSGWENRHIKLPNVSAIFPSITLASWASIFTGKMPNETGLVGNEFFARDIYNPITQNNQVIPGQGGLPSGVVSLDAGAFDPGGAKFALNHVAPVEFTLFGKYDGKKTLSEKLAASAPISALKTPTLWGEINSLVESKFHVAEDMNVRCDQSQYECRTVSMLNQYTAFNGNATRVDLWGTPDSAWQSGFQVLTSIGNAAKVMDKSAAGESIDFLSSYFSQQNPAGKRKRFPALFSIYFSGLDHDAHETGMNAYPGFFKNMTDSLIESIVEKLKDKDEFDNKIFIITADHGHTAMPTELKYKKMKVFVDPESGNVFTWIEDVPIGADCKLKTDFQDSPNDKFAGKNAQSDELSNNNLHIWELGEVMKSIGENGWGQYKVLTPKEIAKLYKRIDKVTNKAIEMPYGATATIEKADIIVGLNGPMAHVYLTDMNKLGKIAELFMLALDDHPAEAAQWWNMDDIDYSDFKVNTIGRLKTSVDKILVRVADNYCVFDGLNDDSSVRCAATDPFAVSAYADAWTRINGVNNKDRSGDIVLIMRDATMGDAVDRYTTGVACKSWHGSLSPSDSYVPFVVSYPGGNKTELEKILQKDTLCKTDYSNCKGNWKLSDVVKEIISEQYK